MPIHVNIDINGHPIEQLHIGRIKGGTDQDDVNTYLAVIGTKPLSVEEWKEYGVEFTHRYGDMALICVQKAISAILLDQEHHLTGESAAGFLSMCSCGEAVDDYEEHLTEKAK